MRIHTVGRLLVTTVLFTVVTTAGADKPSPSPGGAVPSTGKTGAVCIYDTLQSGVTQIIAQDTLGYADQTANFWGVLAVRSASGADWDVHLYGAPAPEFCTGTLLAKSDASSGVDLVVGDFNYSPVGGLYSWINQFSGTGAGTVEYDGGFDALTVNGGPVIRSTGPSDVVEIWDVHLTAGQTYAPVLEVDAGIDARLLIFENGAGTPYYVGRSAAIVDWSTMGAFIPATTGWHGVVVVNENGAAGDYSLEIVDCQSPSVAAAGTNYQMNSKHEKFEIRATSGAWTAAAVRTQDAGTDWDVELYLDGGGNLPPVCLSTQVAMSTGGAGVDFVLADFNQTPVDTLFVKGNRFDGHGNGGFLWNQSAGVISLCTSINDSMVPGDIIKMREVWLDAGRCYEIDLFSSLSSIDLYLFSPANGAWQSKATAHLAINGAGEAVFVAPVSGYWGVAFVSEQAAFIDYSVEISYRYFDYASGDLKAGFDSRGSGSADWDNDGDLDLYVASYHGVGSLLRNDGFFTFADVTPPSMNTVDFELDPTWGDYDNDGDPDLFITSNYRPNRLFRNEGGGSFADVSISPLSDSLGGNGADWIDADNDGDIDLFVANFNEGNQLLRNDSGTFVDVISPAMASGSTWGGAWSDYDDDGDMDVYFHEAGPNRLFRNDGGSAFVDVTAAPLDDGGNGTDAAWADMDLDGDMDLLLVNEYGTNALFMNNGSGYFSSVTIPDNPSIRTRSATWGDHDMDGDPDIYLGSFGGRDVLLINDGPGGFREGEVPPNDTLDTVGAIFDDFNDDGYPDMFITNIESQPGPVTDIMLANEECGAAQWLSVDLEGIISNAEGIGSKITAFTPAGNALREVTRAGAGSSSSSARTTIGLGNQTVDSLVVRWPSGIRQTLIAPAMNQIMTIIEDLTVVGAPDGGDFSPKAMQLHGARPNPFNPRTTISYELPVAGQVSLRIYDIAGRLVRTLVDTPKQMAGSHEAIWDGHGNNGQPVGSGIYFSNLTAAGNQKTKRMVLIR